jgi:hypothetical protein
MRRGGERGEEVKREGSMGFSGTKGRWRRTETTTPRKR